LFIKAQVDFKTGELVLSRRFFLGRVLVPGARLWQIVVVIMKGIVFREANLENL